MTPLSVLRIWFFGLLGFALIGFAGYLVWDWSQHDRSIEHLYWAAGLLGLTLLGRLSLLPFLGGGPSMPRLQTVESHRVRARDGTLLQVHLLKQGAGPAVILTHGWTLNSSIWSYAQQELPAESHVLAWDLRGLGQSSQSPKNDYSLETMAGDLAEVVKLAGDRPVILVGHSIGGMICQTFCRLYPDQLGWPISGLALVNTCPSNPVRTALFAPLWRVLQGPVLVPLLHLTIWLSPLVRLMNLQSYLNGTTHLTGRITSFSGAQTRGQLDHVSWISSLASPAVTARGMLAMLRFDETATLPRIPVPTSVVAGVHDRLTKPQAGEWIAQAVPQGHCSVLKPGGHLTLLERHHEVNRVISVLIEKIAAASMTR